MGDSHHHHHHQTAPPSRLGMRGGGVGGGEIVEVQGGHILRSTGRKDRHSKVCTAKGPRDRRVRLSAPTAIQFYDVQDRLGYDRPSKAVDWLIKKAKAAIDELAELPAWTPSITPSANPRTHQEQLNEEENENENEFRLDALAKRATTTTTMAMVGRDIHYQIGENPTNSSNFLPPSLDSDAIADTIKSFFPLGASAETPSSSIQFQSYPPDLLSRTGSHSQDLRLSLQSYQDPMLLHHQQAAHNHAQAQQNEHALFSATTGSVCFDGGWSHHQQAEISRFQRMVGWNAGGADTGISGGTGGGGGGGGFMFHSPPTSTVQPPQQPFFGHNQLFFQRGPLQSSNTPSIRAWIDPSIAASDHQRHQIQPAIYQSSISGMGYVSGEFSGFCIPARIQGEEEHDGIPSSKPSSASSDSRH